VDRSALLIVIASAFLHAAWSASIKGSRDPLAFNVLQTLLAALGALLVLPMVRLGEIPSLVWWGAALTGVAHGLYMYFLGRAFEEGELSVVYPIVRSTPAFLPLVSVPLLGESVSWPGAAGIAVVVAGIWLVQTRGVVRWSALRGPGTGFALLALATTVAYTLVDKQSMTAFTSASWTSVVPRAIVYFFLLYLTTATVFLPLSLRRVPARSWPGVWRRDSDRALGALAAGVAGYGLILEAFRTTPASYVVAVRQTSVLFALAIGSLWLHERPGPVRALGAAATVLGVALIASAP
jgi:drug/metabolite transporter (DMT)-like permease